MLLGVRPDRADELVAAGHRLRVYVPYGTDWYRVLGAAAAGESRRSRATSPPACSRALSLAAAQAPPTRSE